MTQCNSDWSVGKQRKCKKCWNLITRLIFFLQTSSCKCSTHMVCIVINCGWKNNFIHSTQHIIKCEVCFSVVTCVKNDTRHKNDKAVILYCVVLLEFFGAHPILYFFFIFMLHDGPTLMLSQLELINDLSLSLKAMLRELSFHIWKHSTATK